MKGVLNLLAFTETEKRFLSDQTPEGRRTYRSMNASCGRTEASREIPCLTALLLSLPVLTKVRISTRGSKENQLHYR